MRLATIALELSGLLAWWGWFIIALYWAGGSLILQGAFRFLIDPRLDARYPLSAPSFSLASWSNVEPR